MVGFNLAVLAAERTAEPAVPGVLVGCAPVVVAVLVPLAEGRRPARAVLYGALLVTAGAFTVQGWGRTDAAGIGWSLAALAGEVGFTVLAVPVLRILGPKLLTAAVCGSARPRRRSSACSWTAPASSGRRRASRRGARVAGGPGHGRRLRPLLHGRPADRCGTGHPLHRGDPGRRRPERRPGRGRRLRPPAGGRQPARGGRRRPRHRPVHPYEDGLSGCRPGSRARRGPDRRSWARGRSRAAGQGARRAGPAWRGRPGGEGAAGRGCPRRR